MQPTLPSNLEDFVQQQLRQGRYRDRSDLIVAAVALLQQQQDLYQGRLAELQQDALVGWDAAQRGAVVDGPTAMAQIRSKLRQRYGQSNTGCLSFA